MAHATLSAPGTEFGPCIDENCDHIDCACTRLMAKAVCPYCKKEIGYESQYFDVTEDFSELPEEAIEYSTGKKSLLAHRNCVWKEADRQLVAEGREPMYFK